MVKEKGKICKIVQLHKLYKGSWQMVLQFRGRKERSLVKVEQGIW